MVKRLVTNLRYRALRLRHDWWYRWAHDPLCERLGGGVLAVGRLRICRSCLLMYSGTVVGGVAAATVPALGTARFAPQVWLATAGGLGAASVPASYAKLSRHQKDIVRFATGAAAGVLTAFALARRWRWSAVLVTMAAAAYRTLTLARAKSKATACDGCPELHADGICSGYAQQAVSLRAYERAASEVAMRNYQPA